MEKVKWRSVGGEGRVEKGRWRRVSRVGLVEKVK